MMYGSKRWALNTITAETIAMVQSKMEKIMVGITLHDRNYYNN